MSVKLPSLGSHHHDATCNMLSVLHTILSSKSLYVSVPGKAAVMSFIFWCIWQTHTECIPEAVTVLRQVGCGIQKLDNPTLSSEYLLVYSRYNSFKLFRIMRFAYTPFQHLSAQQFSLFTRTHSCEFIILIMSNYPMHNVL